MYSIKEIKKNIYFLNNGLKYTTRLSHRETKALYRLQVVMQKFNENITKKDFKKLDFFEYNHFPKLTMFFKKRYIRFLCVCDIIKEEFKSTFFSRYKING